MNAYLHIPFCTSICSYCDFTSFAGQEGKMGIYAKALEREIGSSDLRGPLETVYFGGGTPSLLPPGTLAGLLSALGEKAGLPPSAEVSLEANPETVDRERLQAYRALGVDRLSFGAQASQKTLLKALGRGHLWERVEEAFREARAAGFGNINLDLMFGLPGQTLAMFQASVRKAAALGPDHLSLYALQVEEGTPLAAQVGVGLALPSEDETADGYAWAQEFLSAEGFGQYEVSNFAREGKACRHNRNVWSGQDYWGFGLGAVGTVGGIRQSHGEDLGAYLSGEERPQKEILTPQVQAFERIMLGLRTSEGVAREDLDRYAGAQGLRYEERFGLFRERGLLSLEEGRYKATRRGYFVLNGILEALMA